MKKQFRLLAILVAVLFAAGLILPPVQVVAGDVASGVCGDNLIWSLDENGTLTISGTGDMWDYNYFYYEDEDMPTEIPWEDMKENIKSVVIENGVTSIGNFAFFGCNISVITIPTSVTNIGSRAFYESQVWHVLYRGTAEQWREIDIGDLNNRLQHAMRHDNCNGDEITDLENEVCTRCSNFTGVQGFCGDNLTWELDDKGVLTVSGTGKMEEFFYYEEEEDFQDPYYDPTYHAPWYNYAEKITTVVINEGITRIGAYAFYGCDSMSSIVLAESVTSIGEDAFSECNSLIFNEFDTAKYLGNPENPYLVLIGASDDSVTSCDVHNDTKVIADAAFAYGSLTSVNISDNVTHIGSYAFCDCNDLADVTIGNAVIKIGEAAFYGCSSLTAISIPSSVVSIEADTFYCCSKLESVTLHEGLTSIGNFAFQWCTSLTSVVIPNGVTHIGSNAFSFCKKLANVSIPDSLTSVGSAIFNGCDKLVYNEYDQAYYLGNENNPYVVLLSSVNNAITSCNVHEQTKLIQAYAFSRCSSLTNVTIPDGLIGIGSSAFSDCENLVYNEYDQAYYLGNENNPYMVLVKASSDTITSCEVHDQTRFILDKAFYRCNSLRSVVIPQGVTTIGDYAFYYCESLTSVTIPDSVTSMLRIVFYDCPNLWHILYMGTETQWSEISADEENDSLNGVIIHYNCTGDEITDVENKVCTLCDEALGDVNGDGKINTTDAKLIMQYELGLIDETMLDITAADVNGDGKVNTTDAKLIMQYELGIIT